MLSSTGYPPQEGKAVDRRSAGAAVRRVHAQGFARGCSGGRAGREPPTLAPNTMPEPVLERAEHHRVVFGGGMMAVIRIG
jgi:hypothetical protein